jgi:cephalosporin hydroxylase
MDPVKEFQEEVAHNIAALAKARDIQELSLVWLRGTLQYHYSYNFSWLGRPIIQYPQDMIAMQELIWRIKPDLIIETGIAHGGSLILSASMLALLDYCDAIASRKPLDPLASLRRVIGIDIDIRAHNRASIEAHPLGHMIELVDGSSIDSSVVTQVRDRVKSYRRIMVTLDANHTEDHVLAELTAYGPLVTLESYCVVFDTVIEQLPDGTYPDRPWAPGNSPMTAVQRFLARLEADDVVAADGERLRFEADAQIDSKLLISVAPRGYLRRVRPAS